MAPLAPPNYTQIPNEILDRMDEMTPAEFKVLMAICRKTFGWHKDRDVISLTQLEKMTNLGHAAVFKAIQSAIKMGLLERTKVGKQSYSYRLLVSSEYQYPQNTSTNKIPVLVSSEYQQPVSSEYTQKKELKKKENGGVGQNDVTPPPIDKSNHPEIRNRLTSIGVRPNDISVWLKLRPQATLDDVAACEAWCEANGRPHGTLDRPASLLYLEFLSKGDVPPLPSIAKQRPIDPAKTDAGRAAIEAERLDGLRRWERENEKYGYTTSSC